MKSKAGKNKFYSFYRDFLLELFHKGLGQPEKKRDLSVDLAVDLAVDLGNIPYLNGGLFDVHELERQFDKIRIKDDAFEKIFNFFDQWNWHLDTRVEASGKDINPDVIGYIFEKYINDRAAMGAYYTKEDITDYIGKNTIIPFLFDKVKKEYPKAFKADGFIWSFLKESSDTYIYDAVKKGVPQDGDLFDDLPEEVKSGFLPELEKKIVKDSSAKHLWEIRKRWNKKAPEEIALPTEIYREVIERRKRYAEVKSKIENGKITEINDFITYNLNIRQFAQDVLENSDDPDFVRHFYKAIKSVTILDPTCGSGAFLFAALNILEPLYETCIERMEQFTAEEPRKYKFFHEVLAEVNSEEHPNLDYYIYKTIILNNLYGVDIMHEAVEIAKLRLFLKMVGAVDINIRKPNYGLEPLPDVDFNIRAGNTLVGFASEDDFKKAVHEKDLLFAKNIISDFEDEFAITAKVFNFFKDSQTQNSQLMVGRGDDIHKKTKHELQKRLDGLNEKLNEYLASTYGINKEKQKKEYTRWLESHQPFHWLAEFYEIINGNGGFDVVIGNPPYVEYSPNSFAYKITNTIFTGKINLYALVLDRTSKINNNFGTLGVIVLLSLTSTKRMSPLVDRLVNNYNLVYFSHYEGTSNPGTIFEGVKAQLNITLCKKKGYNKIFSSHYFRAYAEERQFLFKKIFYEKAVTNHIGLISKLSKQIASSILNKFMSRKGAPAIRSGNYHLFYRNMGNFFWKLAFVDEPVYKRNAVQISSSTVSSISFADSNVRTYYVALVNSSLFFMYWNIYSDCYHLSKSEILKIVPDVNLISNSYNKLINQLLQSLESNGYVQTENTRSGDVKDYYRYFPQFSKPIIDQIDTVLAQHYGFTEEELDFIINYDIKYRMGKELDAYIEGALGKENIKTRE